MTSHPSLTHLCHSEAPLPTGHHFVPFVVQQVHEAVRLVLAHELRDVGGEGRVLRKADTVAWITLDYTD